MDTQLISIQSYITSSPQSTLNNFPYGDLIHTTQDNSLRLYLQNTNGIYKGNTWNGWKSLTNKSQSLHIDILCLTETNINWNPKIQQIASLLAQKFTRNCQISTSSHNGFTFGMYQPGGTATAVLGNTTGRIHSKIQDPTSMGRWSGFSLNTNHGKIFTSLPFTNQQKATEFIPALHRN
jgi:hypothetical protein